jgi:CubicO group peptidase (beta-lactamase class C family)
MSTFAIFGSNTISSIMSVKFLVRSIFLFFLALSQAQIPEAELDQLVTNTLTTFDVPGISVGILKDGEVVYSKGHGIRSMITNEPMTDKTLVGVASNSKGFTCFALAMMVDAGKLKWDDKVRKHIPEFQLKDPWVTDEFTIRDLVTHRSGLPLGAGDLMFFPEGSDFTVQDIITNLKHLEPESSFRSTFRYNNNFYIVAGEVLKRVSGLSWEEFIETKIMKPVGMVNSKASYNRVIDRSNIIDAHTRTEGEVIPIPHDWSATANAAGGIISNVPDMLTWAQFLIDGAVTASGERLLSEAQFHELWQLQTPLSVRPGDWYGSNFRGYGLGWFLTDVKGGYKQVYHTGGLLGTVTQFTMIPELNLAIVVLTNQMNGSAFNTITNTIKDSYLGYENRDWLGRLGSRNLEYLKYNDSIKASVYDQVKVMKGSAIIPKPEQITGAFTDKWFGDFEITEDGKGYRIASSRSSRLKGELLPYNATTYVAKWDDRSYDADVFVKFTFNEKGKAQSATMSYIAPITDFSFDFHDLHLVRTE